MGHHVDHSCSILLAIVVVLPREGVCHDVFYPGDMGHIGAEFRDERELVPLPVGNRITYLEEGPCKRPLISEDAEISSLENMSEVQNGRVDRLQLRVISAVARLGSCCSSAEEGKGLFLAVYHIVKRACDGSFTGICSQTKRCLPTRVGQQRCPGKPQFSFLES